MHDFALNKTLNDVLREDAQVPLLRGLKSAY